MKNALWLLPSLLLSSATEAEFKFGDTTVRYAVEAPRAVAPAGTTDPAQQVGLILCFPEHDRPTGDEIYPVRESLRRQGLSDNYVLLGIHPQAQKFGDADHEPIRQMIAWASKTYPINPRRIYLYGKGEGAKISGEFGTQNAKLITAAVTYSWGWWKMPSEHLAMDENAPRYYMVLGMRDLLTHIQTVRDTYSRVNAKGLNVIYREFDDLGARTYHPASNDDGLAWALRLRNPNLPLSKEEAALLNPFKPVVTDGYFQALALVGGSDAALILQSQLTNTNPILRAAAAETCAHAIFPEKTIAALSHRLTDREPKVRAAAIRALAKLANWRSAAAQKALIDFVKNTEPMNPADRLSAIDAIGYAVRFQVKGVRQDPALFAALIDLLQDKDEEARVMAANILAPIRDKDFRGDAGRPEAKSPEGGWPKWLAEITAKQAGYSADYHLCKSPGDDAQNLYCEGGNQLRRRYPSLAFEKTKQAAEMGSVPAQAMLGMMYANGTGVQQDYKEAGEWWAKAAAGGHPLAAQNLARVPGRRPPPPK